MGLKQHNHLGEHNGTMVVALGRLRTTILNKHYKLHVFVMEVNSLWLLVEYMNT